MRAALLTTAVLLTGLTACSDRAVEVDDEAGSTSESEAETSESETGTSESTGGSSSDTDSESELGTVDGPGFLDDGFDTGFSPTCDAFLQDCPEGEKCVASSASNTTWDSNSCVPITGEGQPGDPCSSNGRAFPSDDCGEDSMCVFADDPDQGVCRSFCEGSFDNPLCPEGLACVIGNDGAINWCLELCDPLLQDCPGDDICSFDSNYAFVCLPSTSTAGPGAECSGSLPRDCQAGSLCVSADAVPGCMGPSCCAPICDLGAPNPNLDCPAETGCALLWQENPPGFEDVGVCVAG